MPSKLIKKKLFRIQAGECYICKRTMMGPDAWSKKCRKVGVGVPHKHPDNLATFEHVIPISMGGNKQLGNVLLACMKCNSTKSDTLPTKAQLRQLREVNLEIGKTHKLQKMIDPRIGELIKWLQKTRIPLMAATRVEVHLFKDDDDGTRTVFEERIRVRVFSVTRPGVIGFEDMPFATAKAYPGGVAKAVEDLAGFVTEVMNAHPKQPDDLDPSDVAKAAVSAFKDAMSRAEANGFGRYIEIDVDEQNRVVKATGGFSET